jgi:heme/copper-type cytochrome/quinol oxidase subunit 2
MSDAASRELIFVLAAMAVLLVFGIVAVVIFVRTWRKERRQTAGAGGRSEPPAVAGGPVDRGQEQEQE